jgi:hypothetical protein
MLGKTIVITCRWGENPYLRDGVTGPSLRGKSGPRNGTHTKQSLRHPWYLPLIYHGLERGVYIRGTTGDKSIYKLPGLRSIIIVRN